MDSKEYITKSILEASFLSFKGFRYSVHEKKETIYFVFDDIGGIVRSLVDEFWMASKELRLLRELVAVQKIIAIEKRKQYNAREKKRYEKQGGRELGVGEPERVGDDL